MCVSQKLIPALINDPSSQDPATQVLHLCRVSDGSEPGSSLMGGSSSNRTGNPQSGLPAFTGLIVVTNLEDDITNINRGLIGQAGNQLTLTIESKINLQVFAGIGGQIKAHQ